METRLVPISEIRKKGVWHFQPYSQAMQQAEALLEQSPYSVTLLRELVQSANRGFPHSNTTYQTEGIPFIRLNDLKSRGLDLSEVTHISQEDHQKLHQTQIQRGDVLVGLIATFAPINAAVYELDQPANINQHIVRLSLSDRINPYYLVYYLKSNIGQTLLQSHLMGAVTKTMSVDALMTIPVICPPLIEQERIVVNIKLIQQQATQHSQTAEALYQKANQVFDHLLREGDI